MTQNTELTFEQEAAQGKERRERAEAIEKAASEAQEARVAKSFSDGAKVNVAYEQKQAALAKQIAETNAKNTAEQKQRDKEGAARRIAENEARRSYHATTNKPPEGFLDMAGLIPDPNRKPSISLKPQPDPTALAEYHMRKPQPGMAEKMTAIDASHPTVVDFQERPAPSRPTKECPNCGTAVGIDVAWHRLGDDTACVIDPSSWVVKHDGIKHGQKVKQ
jgi:hypothetical protein